MGNLTGLLSKIKPAVTAVTADIKDRTSKNYTYVEMVAENNVRLTVETIREGLTACFENFVEPSEPEVRRFILEIRGPFSLRFENGTEIVQI